MDSDDARRSTEAPDGGVNGQRGPRESRVSVTVDGVALATAFASHEQLHRVAEQYLSASTREVEFLRRIIGQQEGEIASLRQQVAELTRREANLVAPGSDDKPL